MYRWLFFLFFKQKTAYEMRISDWSSDVCSSDLQTLDFYANMASQPLDVIYLGETVCSKRRALMLDDWLGLARDLAEASSAQLVLSGLTLVEAASELSSLRRLCDNGELLVEANDMGAVQRMSERKLPSVGGPGVTPYHGTARAELVGGGSTRRGP